MLLFSSHPSLLFFYPGTALNQLLCFLPYISRLRTFPFDPQLFNTILILLRDGQSTKTYFLSKET